MAPKQIKVMIFLFVFSIFLNGTYVYALSSTMARFSSGIDSAFFYWYGTTISDTALSITSYNLSYIPLTAGVIYGVFALNQSKRDIR